MVLNASGMMVASSPTCLVCGLPMHRFGFPSDMNHHRPTAVACANSIIGELDKALAKEDHDAKENILRRVELAVTSLAIAFERARTHHE